MEHYDKESRRVLSRIGFALFLMTTAIITASIIIGTATDTYMPELRDTSWFLWAATAISVLGIGLPTFYFASIRVPNSEHKEVVKLRFTHFIVLFFISVGAMYLTSLFSVFVNLIIASIIGEEVINPLSEVILNSNFFFTLLYAGILAPIGEEIIFRKLLLNKVRRFGDLPAMLITGFAFGLFHMNLSQFFYATALGIIFAYITLKTNTVRYSILLHIMINLIGTTIVPFVIRDMNLGLIMLMGLWVVTSITLGGTFFALNVKKIKLEKAEMPVDKKSIYFLNFGTILFTVLSLVMTIGVFFA